MVELRMWKWEYTDDAGQRRVSRWLMTEHEALRYKDAVRIQRTLEVRYDPFPLSSPLSSSRLTSSAPPTSTPFTNTIGNVGHPVHILSPSRRRHSLK
jgi:hypothetical protein